MQIDVFTLFPQWFEWFCGQRHVSNALEGGHALRTFNYRDFSPLKHGQVDDTPYGGGAGMVMRVDVIDAALRAVYGDNFNPREAGREDRRVVLLTPSGRQLNEQVVQELTDCRALTLLCGRYEGVDHRVQEHLSSDQLSIGPYVISGGELAAMVVCDAVVRRLPGALGDERSVVEESFSQALGGALEYPHYTRPAGYRGWQVPEVLLSGNHAEIAKWRKGRSRERTEGE